MPISLFQSIAKWFIIFVYLITGALWIHEYMEANSQNKATIIEQNLAAELALHQSFLELDLIDMTEVAPPENLSILIYEGLKLRKWSSHEFVPDHAALSGITTSPAFIENVDGLYLVSFKDRNDQRVFFITTLIRKFTANRTTLDTYFNDRVFEGIRGELSSLGQKIQFRTSGFSFLFQQTKKTFSGYLLALIWLSFALTTIVVFRWLYLRRFRSGSFVLQLIFGAILLKVISLQIPTNELFSRVLPFWLLRGNLLDTLVTCLLFNVVFLFSMIHLNRMRKIKAIVDLSKERPVFFAVLLFVFSALAHFIYFGLIQDLLRITGLNLDITESLEFDAGKIVFIGVILCLSALFFWIIQFLSRLYGLLKIKKSTGIAIVIIIGTLLLISPLEYKKYLVLSHSLLWLLIYHFNFSKNLVRISYMTFFYVIVVIGALSFTNALAIYKNFERKEVERKRSFGIQQLTPRDSLTEKYLVGVRQNIQNDPVIRTRFLSPLLSKSTVKVKVRRQYLTSYFDRFEVDLSLYDIIGDRLDGTDPANKDELLSMVYDHPTGEEGLYFVENWENLGRSKYLLWVPIMNGEVEIGGIAVDLMVKKVIPNSVYPSVLTSNQKSSKAYDYVLMREGALVYAKGNYSFDVFNDPSLWEKLISAKEGIEVENYHLLAIEDDDALMIVISQRYSLRAFLANFSFNFLVFLSFVGLVFLMIRWSQPDQQLTLANRIQLYLGFSFILPLLIVSAVILNLLNSSYRDEIIRNYQKRAITIAENIYLPLEDFDQNQINREDLYDVVGNAATFSQVDMNLYNTRGQLIVSNQPDIFSNKLITTNIPAIPWELISDKPDQSIVMDEAIGGLRFKVVYQGVIDHHTGELLGIVSIPFFDSKNHLNRQQVEVFANLVTVFTIIFLSSVLVGYVILRNITLPLTTLSLRLRQTNLEETNEPVAYQGRDEIGQLVAEYNRMLEKLEHSKAALALSQKETAWKEIARQVAHEIKNPLTPMRLKIQQLVRTNSENERLIANLNSLINQIDTLSEIADSFSAFAKMPAPNNEEVPISDLLMEVVQLYRNEKVQIDDEVAPDKYVFADPNILGRVFNNLLLNGIQSVLSGRPHLVVGLAEKDEKLVIEVIDNGQGIPEQQQKKIFTPYFSTKEKGTGIGLAIAKKGIEQAGGSIWFDSEEGKGTTFTVILPVLRV
ncbi:MAG: HAMP domain-containing sensor histidine kinase [Cytophagales bacterium]|nr:HAMP domain-containing sensor histidine kinase [Cytophagales bacterium]